jgi:antitoxin (DNA-binding transcriptional repressor) of toxin-antitoxin stability system
LAKEFAVDTVTINTAKTSLSRLLARVDAGEEIIVARGKKPIAQLVPCQKATPKRRFGALKGIITIDPAVFDPLPPEELAAWEQ